jgi:ActR/RegA family two-component response regulator
MGGLVSTRRPSIGLRSFHWPAHDHESERVPGRFILASDDDQLRHVVNAAIRQLGCAGTFVRSGVDVMNCAYRRPPRLVLLDQCLRDLTGLDVARALSGHKQTRFVLIGSSFTTSATVAAMKLGAFTVLEKPVGVNEMVALLRPIVDGSDTTGEVTNSAPDMHGAPRSVAERWALKVLHGCEADTDLKTLAAWAAVVGLSYSSLCELCRLLEIQPLAARDLTRVLRAVIQSRVSGGRIGDLLDVCDRRTLDALMKRAAVSPRQRGREIPVDQFLASQQFVPAGNAGLEMLRALLSD